MVTEVKKKFTAAEYLELPEGPPQQLIDGEIIMTPAPSYFHQSIILEIASIMKDYATNNNLGYVNIAPIDVFLKDGEVYQPDVVFVSNKHKSIIGESIRGIPDLVVEVLSPSNAYYDLTHKKNIYEESGLREFWVIDPEEKTVEVYENVKNTFVIFSKARKSGAVESKLLAGLKVEIEKLFAPI